jgi:hypothetical protein
VIRRSLICMLYLFGLTGSTARGAFLFESATLGPTGVSVGPVPGVDVMQYLGARFHVDREVEVQSVGGHIMGWGGE